MVDEEKINCSFEENFCLWRQDFDDDGDWLRAQGANLPPNTGPSFDHTTGDQSGAIKHSHNYRPNCLLLPLWKSVPAPNRMVKFGTQIEDSLNINHSKFGVSNSNPLAPPTAYICTHVYANNLAEGSIAPYDVILNFSKKLIFELLLPYCSNFLQKSDHLQSMLTRSQVDHSNSSWITREPIWRKACQNRCEAISPQRFSVLRPNLVCVIISMTWGYLHSFGAAPPSDQEIWKMAIFAYKFWMVWPKITRLVS